MGTGCPLSFAIHFDGLSPYTANRDARAPVTAAESVN